MRETIEYSHVVRIACTCILAMLSSLPTQASTFLGQRGFSGIWHTNFGMLTLDQQDSSAGIQFTGVMTDASTPRARGVVTGTLTDGRLSGLWSLGSKSGKFQDLELDAKEETFTGSATGYTTWCGARQGKPLPPGCAFSGQWTIELNGAGTGTLTLVQTSANVSGTFSTKFSSGKLIGTVIYTNGLPMLSGKWSSSRSGGLFKAYLNSFDARQFQGNFDGKLAFCGWRSNVSRPTTCLK